MLPYLQLHLLFYHNLYARQLSNRSMFHAGRYLDDKEICYLWTIIVIANVSNSKMLVNTGHISVLKSKHLVTKACVFAIQSVDTYYCYP